MSLMSIIFALIIFALVFWAANRILAAFGIGDPIATVIYVLLVLFFVLYLLSLLGAIPAIRVTG